MARNLLEKALEYLVAARKHQAGAEVFYFQGIILDALLRPRLALQSFDKGIAADPRHVAMLFMRSLLQLDLHRPKAALKEAKAALRSARPTKKEKIKKKKKKKKRRRGGGGGGGGG